MNSGHLLKALSVRPRLNTKSSILLSQHSYYMLAPVYSTKHKMYSPSQVNATIGAGADAGLLADGLRVTTVTNPAANASTIHHHLPTCRADNNPSCISAIA